jgi:hypothetical protein
MKPIVLIAATLMMASQASAQEKPAKYPDRYMNFHCLHRDSSESDEIVSMFGPDGQYLIMAPDQDSFQALFVAKGYAVKNKAAGGWDKTIVAKGTRHSTTTLRYRLAKSADSGGISLKIFDMTAGGKQIEECKPAK